MAEKDEGTAPNFEERNDGRLDLTLRRVIDVPRAFVWKVWTEPQHLVKWWAPRPWSTPECTMDLRPGGGMRTVLRSPEGQDFPYVGCFLEVIPQEKIVLTNALEPGYRPSLDPFFSVILTFKDLGNKTDYTRWFCIAMKRARRSTRRWASTRAGARRSSSSSRWRRNSSADAAFDVHRFCGGHADVPHDRLLAIEAQPREPA